MQKKVKKSSITRDAKKIILKKRIKKSALNTSKTSQLKNSSKNNSISKVKRVIIVHGWDGDITAGWFPWIKKNLEDHGFEVLMEEMPDPNKPVINEWVSALDAISGNLDENTYFVGHSVGCQTIIRMLEKSDVSKIGGAVFLAGWFDLKEYAYKEDPKFEKETREIAKPWLDKNLDFDSIQLKFDSGKITAVFSDNDYYVDVNNAELFKEKLGARIIIES